MTRPSQNTISAAYFGQPDKAFSNALCGRFAPVDEDLAVYEVSRLMTADFRLWQIFLQATANETAARVKALH